MTHKILVEYPDKIHAKLEDIKKISGVAVTNIVKTYTYRGLLADGYATLDELRED